jgi:transposase
LRQQGWSIKEIARHLHCHPKSISRYLRRQLPLAPRQGTRTRRLAAFEDYLRTRWNAGCHNASQLYREIRQQGYAGRLTMVGEHVAKLRRQSGIAARSRQPGGTVVQPDQVRRSPTTRLLAWLATQPVETLTEERQQWVSRLSQINATLKTAVDLAQAFSTMVRQRLPEQLDAWLDQATQSELAPLRTFAHGLREDYSAVRAALTLVWSNGRTEGSVNRLKCLKRQMYGRGGLELLRRRLMAT